MRGIDEFQLGGIVLQLLWELVVRWTWRSNNEVVMSTDTDENLDDFVVVYPVCPTTTTGALLRRFRRDYCRNVALAPPVKRLQVLRNGEVQHAHVAVGDAGVDRVELSVACD